MRLLNFLFFSSIEFSAGFILILSLFRFQLRGYIAHIAFGSIILAQASFMFNDVLHWEAIAPVLQLIIFILFLWLMFRIHIFYAAVMSIIGYLVYSLLQTILLFVFEWLNIFTIDQVLKIKSLGYLLQVITSSVSFTISWLLYHYRIGFSFVPDTERQQIKLRGENIRFLIVMFFATLIISISYIYILKGFTHIIISGICLAAILTLLLFLSIRRESRND